MTLLATFDHLWESKWNPIRNYQTVSLGTRVNRPLDFLCNRGYPTLAVLFTSIVEIGWALRPPWVRRVPA